MGNLEAAYRPHVDGLRAIAVSLVVLYHAFPEAIPGGFVGVDIFFVISGYLITGIIARDLGRQHFSLADFYARRIRRIFPALIVVLVAVLAVGYMWLLPATYRHLGVDALASAGFSANIALMLQSGYFDVESAKKPLLHLWSLGIEEQFYLLWPLILIVAARLGLSLLRVAAILGAASFVLNLVLLGENPIATFYLPFTRAFELFAGAMLAVGWLVSNESGGNWRAIVGLLLIVVAAALFDSRSPFPGWRAALPVVGTALMLSAPAAWCNRVVLASRPMVHIGLISYPHYLWHWPLLVYFTIIKFNPLTLLERGLVVCLSLVLAWATFRFIEAPIRFGRLNVRIVGGLAAAMILIAVVGGAVVRGDGFDFRFPEQVRALAALRTDSAKMRFHECLLDLNRETTFADSCVDEEKRPLVFLWGDSTAAALLPGLRKAQETHDFGLAQYTSSSCAPALNVDITGVRNCRTSNDRVLSIARRLDPDIVLLHATWGKNIDNVVETVATLKQQTRARVVVLGPVPWWRRGLPNEAMRYFMLHHTLIPERFAGAITSNWYDAVMRGKLEPPGAEFISAWDTMCDASGCLTRVGGTVDDLLYSDGVHLTDKGATFVVSAIIDRLLGRQDNPRRTER